MNKLGNCEVCKVDCITRCGHCKKVFYCSATCQKSHRKLHKSLCYPAEIVENSLASGYQNNGKKYCLRTTRDIEENEIILSELNGISGPTTELPKDFRERGYIPICLACHKLCEQNCQRCQWPVCGSECQNNPKHKGRECTLLTKADFTPRKMMVEYEMISVIRIFLLKTSDRTMWDQIMKLESRILPKEDKNPEQIRAEEYNEECSFTVFQDMMGLKHISKEEIRHVQNVWKGLSVSELTDSRNRDKLELILYPFSSLLAHSCVINIKNLAVTSASSGRVHIKYIASTQIPASSVLSDNVLYGNIMLGTRARREQTFQSYRFWCTCDRCKDPSELGTYSSAIKCPEHLEEVKEYLLPLDPLNQNTDWKCTSSDCGKGMSSSNVVKILDPIEEKVNSFVNRADERGFEQLVRLRDIEVTDTVLISEMIKYDEELIKLVHPNHYLRFKLRKKLLFGMTHVVSCGLRNPEVAAVLQHQKYRMEILERMYNVAKDCTNLAKKILPGFSLFYGKTLYFLAVCRWCKLIEIIQSGNGSEEKIEEILAKANDTTEKVKKSLCGSGIALESLGEVTVVLIGMLNFLKSIVFSRIENGPNINIAGLSID